MLFADAHIKITDTASIVRRSDGKQNAGDLIQRGSSWPGQNGRPVYNFRSDGRGCCLIIANGFYEFTDPPKNKKKRKDKWLFAKNSLANVTVLRWRAHSAFFGARSRSSTFV